MRKATIENYRKIIEENVGNEISLSVKKGRKVIIINNCIIECAYSRIFTVRIIGESIIKCDTMSVCYADLLTGNARVILNNLPKEA